MDKILHSRRRFLRDLSAGSAALAGMSLGQADLRAGRIDAADSASAPAYGTVTELSPHLLVYHGPVNVGVIRQEDKALLIDCGDGSVAGRLGELGITSVERIVFTHHHRDQACGAPGLAGDGTKIAVFEADRDYFADVQAYWNDPKSRWHLYNYHPHHLMSTESIEVDETLADGQTLEWGPAKLQVVATPGHTNGSVSYLVEVDGRRVMFCGDAIYSDGQIWDIHSLQKGFERGDRKICDYHGFLGAQFELIDSLGKIKAAQPESLVPSHGVIMNDPPAAIDLLIRRLAECYDRYVAISALRHYFPQLFEEYVGRPGHMKLRSGKTPPDCLRHFGTTWIVVSKDKAAFVMDCGSKRAITGIEKLITDGEVNKIEGLWVTHYHDDHVDSIPEFQEKFDCPCLADRHVAEVISDPLSWRIPCISPSVAKVDKVTADGQSWQWREFRMTAYYFPGQTLYHDALFVEGQGVKMLFVGDSFTPGGIDDYCALNRNWLGDGVGFDRCIALIERLKPTHIFNCHVPDAFDFTPGQCRQMRANLAKREELFGQIVPWDHANFGMDQSWVRPFPYEQQAKAGSEVKLDVVVTNHAAEARNAACRIVMPRAWTSQSTTPSEAAEWVKATIPAKTEGNLSAVLRIPGSVKPGRYPVAIDIRYGRRELPQFAHAVVVVE
jgi:glyoxylase-like metal-dependent hydrolase (beta-lactamase superfamily II)